MENIRAYLLSIVTASFICSIVISLLPKDSAQKGLIRMICGLFLAMTAISPFSNFRTKNINDFWTDIQTESDVVTMRGESMANDAYNNIIKEKSEAYILDKASVMGLNIDVEVTLSDTVPSSPYSVEVTGAISPYYKNKLQEIIANDLAIPEDRQIWK